MKARILIVDDDDDFRTLLSDLYVQADYDVVAVSNAVEALDKLDEDLFALCVTDHQMPELKGVEFVEKCRKLKPTMPLIMVSAYLDETISSRLKSLQVEVFHKPLNIMSLLRKTSEMIQNTPVASTSSVQKSVFSDDVSPAPNIPTRNLLSFPFKSSASKKLKKELESIGPEMPNMVLVGSEGFDFESVCSDIESVVDPKTHSFIYLEHPQVSVFEIFKLIAGKAGGITLVFVLTDAYKLETEQKQTLLKLYQKAGPFAGVANPVRLLFCLHDDLDALFASGRIDQDFYLILGQKELFLPRLDDCKEDIPEVAEQIAIRLASPDQVGIPFVGFDPDTRELLEKTAWKFNHESLRRALASALKAANGSIINSGMLQAGIANPLDTRSLSSNATLQPAQESDSKTLVRPPTPPSAPGTPPAPTRKPSVSLRPAIPNIQNFKDLANERKLAEKILLG